MSSNPTPRIVTLDVLCRFIGHSSFTVWRESLKHSPYFESGFFTTVCISSADLRSGERMLIGWMPNRLITLEYLGESRFRVLKSENAKLKEGDCFSAAQFLLGYPLFIDHIDRADGPTPAYVAGKNTGLNRLEKL